MAPLYKRLHTNSFNSDGFINYASVNNIINKYNFVKSVNNIIIKYNFVKNNTKQYILLKKKRREEGER